MKSCIFFFLAIITVNLGDTAQLAAQIANSGIGTNGMFGYRVIGGPSLGVSTSGMFGDRFVGPALSSHYGAIQTRLGMPSSPGGQAPYSTSFAPSAGVSNIGTNYNNTNNPNNQQEQTNMPEVPSPQSQPYPAPNELNGNGPNGTQGMTPAEQAPGMPTGAGTPAAMNTAFPRGWGYDSSALTVHAPTYARSAELSDRLTQIARERGMLAGRRIDVSLQGDTAVLQGTVRTPAERLLLANVLSLEPKVQRIDNRLSTERNTAHAENLQSR